MASAARTRGSRRAASRVGAVVASFVLTLTVLASTVTAAPTLPAWVLLPLEASGMPAHMTGGTIVTTTPERADINISLADHAAQERAAEAAAQSTKARTESLASRAQRPEKAEPAVTMNERPVSTPGGENPVLVPDAGEETLPEPEPTTVPVPEPEVTTEPEPEVTEEPEPEPEVTEEPQPEESEPPVTADPAPAPAPEESEQPAEEPTSPAEGSTPSPSPSTSPSPSPSPSPSASPSPAPSPSPSPAPSPSPSATPKPKPTPTPTPTPTPRPTPSPTPTPKPTPTPTPPPAETPGKCSASSARNSLTALLNSYRASQGRAPVAYSTHLQSVAQNWANHLASWQPTYITDGHNPNYRTQVGVGVRGSGWTRASELLVRNTGGASMACSSLFSWMHTWWVNSPNHEPWMKDAGYTHVGYGFAYSPSGVPYAVTIIGKNG